MEGSPIISVSGASWFASRRWTAVRARGQDWLQYETERDSTKDFVREENGRENETDSVKTKADGTTFLFFILQWYIVYIVNEVLALGLSDQINAQRAPYVRTVIL